MKNPGVGGKLVDSVQDVPPARKSPGETLELHTVINAENTTGETDNNLKSICLSLSTLVHFI